MISTGHCIIASDVNFYLSLPLVTKESTWIFHINRILQIHILMYLMKKFILFFSGGFPGGSVVKNPLVGDMGSIPGLRRSPGEGNGNSLQYPCLGNPMDRGAWRAMVHGVAKSQTRLTDFHFHFQKLEPNVNSKVFFKAI